MKTLNSEERRKLNKSTLRPNFDINKLYEFAGVVYENVDKYIENRELYRGEKRNNRGFVLYCHNGEESREFDTKEELYDRLIRKFNGNRDYDYNRLLELKEFINTTVYVDYYI